MRRALSLTPLFLVGLFGLTLLFPGSAGSQSGAAKLPTCWDKLKLSDGQKEKVLKIQGDYQAKVKKLQKELDDLEAQRRKDLYAVLDEDQKKSIVKTYV